MTSIEAIASQLNFARSWWRQAYDALVANRRRQMEIAAETKALKEAEPVLETKLNEMNKKFVEACDAFRVTPRDQMELQAIDLTVKKEPCQKQ